MLQDNQITCIGLLLAGKKIKDIATTLGINRETIWLWRNNDAEFIATYNRERNAVLMGAREEMLSLVSKAVDVLKESMTAKEALEILKLVYEKDFSTITNESREIDENELLHKLFDEKMRQAVIALKKQGKTKQEAKEAIKYDTLNGHQKSVFNDCWSFEEICSYQLPAMLGMDKA